MFKKLINDSRSEEWNIVMYALLLAGLFFLVFTPIILFGLTQNPELAETLTEVSDTPNEKIYDMIYSTRSILEFFIGGTVLEFLRRKRSMKFKIIDTQSTKFLFYFVIEMMIYNILSILGGVLI